MEMILPVNIPLTEEELQNICVHVWKDDVTNN